MPNDVKTVIQRKQAVIFDLFHTLTGIDRDAERPRTAELLGVPGEVWRRQLLDHSRERLVGEIADPYEIIRTLAHAIDPSIPEETILKTTDNRIARFADTLKNIPSASVETLKALRAAGKKIALISNADAMEARAWDESPIAGFFDEVLFSCHVGWAKPEPEIYEECLRRLDLPAGACAFVGDGGSNELRTARAHGLTTVMFTGVSAVFWPHEIDAIRPDADYEISDLRNLLHDE